jgi:hypothetical protein
MAIAHLRTGGVGLTASTAGYRLASFQDEKLGAHSVPY